MEQKTFSYSALWKILCGGVLGIVIAAQFSYYMRGCFSRYKSSFDLIFYLSVSFFLTGLLVWALIKGFVVYHTDKDGIRLKDLITDRYIPWDEIDSIEVKEGKMPWCYIKSKTRGTIRFPPWFIVKADDLCEELEKYVPEEKFK